MLLREKNSMLPLPNVMTAVEISSPGGPDNLVLCQRPVPIPSIHEVLIKISAAGVNRPDCLQRQGYYPPPKGASDIPGLEVSGIIAAVGSAVNSFTIGDRVCALLTGGGYAEYCVVPALQCLPIPIGLTMYQAAALPETFFTVWSNIFDLAYLKIGETLLVHGGASGIGTAAIQITKALNVPSIVFTTVSSSEKVKHCLALGAEYAINYREQDFVDVIQEVTSGRGVDIILDMVGGDYTPRNIKALAPGGRLVHIAFLRGAKTNIDIASIMRKRIIITGSTLRTQSVEYKALIANNLISKIWPLISNNKIKPIIDRQFLLSEASSAHRLMESNKHMGKIILIISND